MIEVEMTSLEIAELTKKEHKHINATIRKYATYSSLYEGCIKEDYYVDKSNRNQKMYTVRGDLLKALKVKYSFKHYLNLF